MQIPTLWDLLGNIIGLVFVFGSVFLLRKLKDRMPHNSIRKILHFTMGFWIFTWFLFETRIGAVITPIIATIALATASCKVKDSFSEEKERHIGLVIYASSITWVTLFFWQEQPGLRLWIGAGAFLSLAWGDGLGGYFGKKFGAHTYQFPWAKQKSLEGSLGVGIGTACALCIAQLVFGEGIIPIMIVIGVALTMVVEGLAPKHSDNLFVPLTIVVLFTLLVN